MIKEKAPMPLFQKIFYILSFIFLFSAFIYIGVKNYRTSIRDIPDNEVFTKEYGITTNNIYVYKTAKEVLELMNSGSGIIFLAFPENDWSHTYAEILNETAQRFDINEIWYYNFKKDRSTENNYYNNILKQLDAYLPRLDNDTKNIYAPTMVIIKNGEVIAYDDETSIIHGDTSVTDYWTNEKKQEKMLSLGVLINRYLEVIT